LPFTTITIYYLCCIHTKRFCLLACLFLEVIKVLKEEICVLLKEKGEKEDKEEEEKE
jgi:hypothetical protein